MAVKNAGKHPDDGETDDFGHEVEALELHGAGVEHRIRRRGIAAPAKHSWMCLRSVM